MIVQYSKKMLQRLKGKYYMIYDISYFYPTLNIKNGLK